MAPLIKPYSIHFGTGTIASVDFTSGKFAIQIAIQHLRLQKYSAKANGLASPPYFAEAGAGLFRWWFSTVVSVSGCMMSV